MLLKVLFGTFATPSDLAQNVCMSIATHEMRLLAYRQNALYMPTRGAFQQGSKRPNPHGTESQEDPYFSLIVHFAIEFEKTYILWLYEVLNVVEDRQKQALMDVGGASSQ